MPKQSFQRMPARLSWGSEQAEGLAHFWPLNEGAGRLVEDFGGQYEPGEASAHLVHGVLNTYDNIQGPLWDLAPGWGVAPYFSGAGGTAALREIIDFAGPGGITALDIDLPEPFTIAVWVVPTFANGAGAQAFGKILSRGATTPSAPPYIVYDLGVDGSSPAKFEGGISDGTTQKSITGTTTLTSHALYHVALTYDKVTLRLYVNGVEEASMATTISVSTSSQRGTRLGMLETVTANNVWKGFICEVRMYRLCKTAEDIFRLYDWATRFELYRALHVSGRVMPGALKMRRTLSQFGARIGARHLPGV